MIRTVIVGAARMLFNAALLAFCLGLLLLYASYRLVRSTVAKSTGQPVREAGFATLMSIVVLAQAVKATQKASASMVAPRDETVDEMVAAVMEGRYHLDDVAEDK
jgi:hypothetical protein